MLNSMYAATSGMRAHQKKMDVIANNVANVGTIGYKKSTINFSEMLNQTIQGASSPGGNLGGTNPISVGLGSKVSSMNTHFTQGALISTERSSDLAIQGSGFFVVSDGTETFYTRNGNFSVDSQGFLVTGSGHKVLGKNVGGNGLLEPIQVPLGETQKPKQTSKFSISNNLQGDLKAGETVDTSTEVFDNLGGSHIIKSKFVKGTTDNTWEVELSLDESDPIMKDWINKNKPDFDTMSDTEKEKSLSEANDALIPNRKSKLVFTPKGDIDIAETQNANGTTGKDLIKALQFSPKGAEKMDININLDKLTQYSSDSTIVSSGQDGNPPGVIKAISFDPSGNLYGIFTNGFSKELAGLSMATFANEEGLSKTAGTMFRKSANSGEPVYGKANSDGKGAICVGYLEASNVDLSNDITEMIQVQRGYAMNAKMITVSDEMLQELTNIKR